MKMTRLRSTGAQIIISLSGQVICRVLIRVHGTPWDSEFLKASCQKVGVLVAGWGGGELYIACVSWRYCSREVKYYKMSRDSKWCKSQNTSPLQNLRAPAMQARLYDSAHHIMSDRMQTSTVLIINYCILKKSLFLYIVHM